MSEWRHRGFVDDSEEEDGELSSDSAPAWSGQQIKDATAEDFEELEDFDSAASSPLTEPELSQEGQRGDGSENAHSGVVPPSQPEGQLGTLESTITASDFPVPYGSPSSTSEEQELDSLWPAAPSPSQRGQPAASLQSITNTGAHQTSSTIHSAHPDRHTFSFESVVEEPDAPHSRNLRSRTFAQLHPYLLDRQQHKEQMQARGLRPFRIVTDQDQATENTPDNSEASEGSDENSIPTITDSQGYPLPVPKPNPVPHSFRDEDDLPDIDALFRRKIQGTLRLGFKRRKMYSARDRAGNRLRLVDGFDVPLSPSNSVTSSLPSMRPQSQDQFRPAVFHMPRGPSPVCLPTPVMSSEIRRPAKPVFEVLSDSELESVTASVRFGPLRESSPASTTSSASTSSSPDVDETRELQWARKRMKGVLPASWLRLDKQTQKSRAPAEIMPETTLSPLRSSAKQRGVAQRRQKRKTANPVNQNETIYIPDDGPDILQPMSPILQDLEEEDFIDPMLPSAQRRRSMGQNRKRQSKLPFTLLKNPPDVQLQRASASLVKSAPRLSILDAPKMSTAQAIPPFIKLALRRVRKRRDGGRHSPTAKAIRLHTRQDTGDAQATLQDWRGGNIKAVRTPVQGRRPLTERTANDQRPPSQRRGYGSDPSVLIKRSQRHDVGMSYSKKAPLPQAVRRPRKRPAQRLDIEAIEYRQPTEEPVLPLEDVTFETPKEEGLLQSLGPFGTRYTWTFDVVPLHMGTFFHESTFVGSGGLKKAAELTSRDLNTPAGHTTIQCANTIFRWGFYTEEVASELETAFQEMQDDLAAGGLSAMSATRKLMSVVTYYSESLNFLDPIDARFFVAKSLKLCDGLLGVIAMERVSDELLAALSYLLVLADQTYQVALYAGLNDGEQHKARRLMTQIGAALLKAAIIENSGVIRKVLDDNKQHTIREQGIRENDVVVESIVVAAHIFGQARNAESGFWTLLEGLLMQLLTEPLDHVNTLERIWEKIFIVLPFLEIDIAGVSKPGQRFLQPAQENWNIVRQILSRLFAVYSSASLQRQAPTLNEYLRANLARVYHLIQAWGWRKCESVIGTVFDFFAGNGLAQLSSEELRGSAPFLKELDQSPALTVERQDRSFHVLLKIIGTGMQNMRQVYSDKKLRSIAWRLIPNHGRSYRKEDAIRQEDLDALRNHHDLLCTLYWACPPESRPRLDLVRNLVDHSTSHREACLVNIRAWANLARWQLSVDEPTSSLQPFGEWLNDILQQSILQHKLAKTEAENYFELSKAASAGVMTKQLVYTTTSKNQKHVEAALSEALLSLKEVLKAARNEEAASVLLQAAAITNVFKMFDPNNSRLGKVIRQALDVYVQYMELFTQKGLWSNVSEDSEESQDYGDFSALEDLVISSEPSQPLMTVLDQLLDPLAQLLSSCFGSETAADEILLIKVVDTWSMLAACLVKRGKRTWSSYIDDYTAISWRQLRDTEQKRKFGVYFMSSVVKLDRRSYQDNAETFHLELLSSLVERESMLKYQHLLHSSLLNVDPGNKILLNLPFRVAGGSGGFDISLMELREARLSVVSSILSNMRESFDEAMHKQPDGLVQLRQEYSTLLKHLMTTMKRNYQELGQGSDIRGAYVDFVHRVIEFLQQHTSDICQIDKFFTDSAAFPLPARDPTYVVGRLKSYALKLTDARSQKQLAVFVRTISERAAVDNQQSYLVAQLHAAMRNTFETGDPARPTLRRLLLGGIFPAYIKQAFSSPCGWILARPILQTSKLVLEELLYDMSISHAASVASVVQMATTVLCAIQQTTDLLVQYSELLDQPSAMCVLREIFNSITAALALLDYIQRASSQASCVVVIQYFRSFALFVAASVLGHTDVPAPSPFESPPSPALQEPNFASLQEFCDNELQQALHKAWVKHGDEYYVFRGSMRSEVIVDLGNPEAEKRALIRAIEGFFGVLGSATVLQ